MTQWEACPARAVVVQNASRSGGHDVVIKDKSEKQVD
jgi:hypothetical protein